MDNIQIALVQNSFAKVLPIADTAAELFYADLFETAPEVRPYFANAICTSLRAASNGYKRKSERNSHP